MRPGATEDPVPCLEIKEDDSRGMEVNVKAILLWAQSADAVYCVHKIVVRKITSTRSSIPALSTS